MAHFNLNNFKATVLGQGLAKPTRFEVIISPPPGLSSSTAEKVSLLCEQASLPMLNLNVKPYRVFGPSYQRPVTSEYGGEGIPLTFHVDRKMMVKEFFDNWIQLIVNRDNYTVSYQDNYASVVDIYQLDEANNYTYHIQLLEAFPRSMNLMELNHSSQSQTHRLTVLFVYRKWISYFGSYSGSQATQRREGIYVDAT